jgi:hypothetical protein
MDFSLSNVGMVFTAGAVFAVFLPQLLGAACAEKRLKINPNPAKKYV